MTLGKLNFKIVVSTCMEKSPAIVAKLTRAIAQLSNAVSQLQATRAIMAIRPITLKNDLHVDNNQGDG